MKSCRSAVLAVFVLALFAFPGYSFAHSALVSAVPHEFSESEVTELQLTFNEAIEPASRVEVANADGEEQAISETMVNGEVLTAVFETPLRDGVYTVNWRIISADGHPVRGSYSIQVQIPEKLLTPSPDPESDDQLPENSASPSTEPEQSSAPVPSESPADASEPEAPASESGKIDATTWILIAAAVLLGYAIISTVLKKKKK
ncbi:copper resistance protein CopC [Paenibacillaceae bacterium WGS1546]|uniref:copper resistance protein CopC n=1 Tax=Cohnella sp. WGS1546 TaxID=3366810 RepID=UPI00372D3A88